MNSYVAQHDVFICHASEDKDDIVRPLAKALKAEHIDVWYDEFSLKVGDSLRQAIDRGLAGTRYGIVVLSPAFFKKQWPHWELNGLVARMMREGRGIILPIWHHVGADDVIKYSPPLADIRALQSTDGVAALCSNLLAAIRPTDGPLTVAKEELLRFGWNPPPISDEWWLDMVEAQSAWDWPIMERLPWLFPLPGDATDHTRNRGLAIAWTALQLDWQEDARRLQICQTTHPDRVFEFIDSNLALTEICDRHPDVLANYAPQLLIPEFSGRYADAFDRLLHSSITKIRNQPDTRFPTAICERYYTFRCANFGGHEAKEIVEKWITGRGGDHSAQQHEVTDYLFWLLSDDSAWLPEKIRNVLLQGMKEWWGWHSELGRGDIWDIKLGEEIYCRKSRPMRWTRLYKSYLEADVARSFDKLGIILPAAPVAKAFMEHDFSGAFDKIQKQWRRR